MTARQRDLLQTLVVLGVLATPGWLLPPTWGLAWLAAVAVLAGPSVWLTWSHAPFVVTPASEVERIVTALRLRPDESFCDLGAGDGQLLVEIRRRTGARCHGIEATPLLYAVARMRIAASGLDRATIRLGDLYRADLSEVAAVYVWGTAYGVGTKRFRQFLEQALPPGARVVSYHTPLWGEPAQHTDTRGLRPLHVYILPGTRPAEQREPGTGAELSRVEVAGVEPASEATQSKRLRV